MVESSILFDPEIDERELDREVGKVNESLDEAASGIQTDIEADMNALEPTGGNGGFGEEPGAGGGIMDTLGSVIPKPVAGVITAAALPVSLSGALGVSMARAMENSSARLQTSMSLLGQAWANVWRPLGDNIDDLFIRPVVMDILRATEDAGEFFRQAEFGLSGAPDMLRGIGELTSVIPVVGDDLQSVFDAAAGVAEDLDSLKPPSIPAFPGWPTLPEFSWPDVGLPDWPSTNQLLNQFPSLSATSLRNRILSDDTGGNGGDGGLLPDWLDPTSGGGDWVDRAMQNPGANLLQSGGIVSSGTSFVAGEGQSSEAVLPLDSFYDQLENAVRNGVSGGARQGGASMDTRSIERRLDRLHDDLRRLESAVDLSVQIGDETVARASSNGERNRMADTDPMA